MISWQRFANEVTTMDTKILLVDDEPNVLRSLRRQLRSEYEVDIHEDPTKALQVLSKKNTYAVVISDFRMPKMNGAELLRKVRKVSPETTRVMLTGYADLENTIKAVNEGNVFRFLTKPCSKENLLNNIKDAVAQHELVTSKRILLEKTLKGSVELLSEITSLINPNAGARINRVRRYVKYFAQQKGIKDLWRYDVATMLCQLGTLILPPGTLESLEKGKELTAEQLQMFEMHPMIAQSLLSKLPMLESVAEMVSYQLKGYDGSGTPRSATHKDDIPLGGRVLKLALDYDLALQQERTTHKAFAKLEENVKAYDPELFGYLKDMLGVEARYVVRKVKVSALIPGMILHEDLLSSQNVMLLGKNLELDKDKIDRIQMFKYTIGVKEPITVLMTE